MSEWKTYTLGDFAEINPRINLKQGNEYSFVEMKDLDATFKYVSPSTKKELKGGAKFQNGDTLFARITPCLENGKICQVKNLENNVGFGSTEFLVFRGKENISKSDFVYYLSRSEFVKNNAIQMMTGTSGRQRVEKSALEELEITVPDLATQTQIAQILTSLDDKIELNLQMNQTLEEMAQAIFKEWFVNFNFPNFDGEMENGLPKGWRNEPIGELFKLTIGGDWGKEEFSDEFPENSYVIRGTDFDKIVNGNILSVPNRFIKQSNFIKRKIENGDILLEISGGSKDQPTGRTILFTDELLSQFNSSVVPASFCRLIRPLNLEYSLFLDIFFKYFYQIGGTWEYQNQSTGISNFQFTFFSENKKIALPEDEILIRKFSEIIKSMKKRIDENSLQIQTLSQTRDTLLPKLMSGKITIEDAKI
jgi:type I restriction enzyme S subunit